MLGHSAISESPISTFDSGVPQQDVSQTVDFTHVIGSMKVTYPAPSQIVEFTHTAIGNLSTVGNPAQTVEFTHQATGRTVHTQSVSHTVDFTHVALDVGAAEHRVEFTHLAEGSVDGARNNLEFTHLAAATVQNNAYIQDVEFTQSVSRAGSVFNRTETQTVGFTHSVIVQGPLTCNDPGIGNRITVLFSEGAESLELAPPEFGNQTTVDTQTLVGRLRGGAIRVVRGANWPVLKILTMNFAGMTKAKRDEVIAFFELKQGLELTFRDLEENVWEGVLVSNEIPLIAESRGCIGEEAQYSVAMKFMGTIIL